ncbi:Bug family tripartite tricarboxylate transporter substrate binding protein [Microbacterium sp. NPDC078428]|uniref:Bug family tripartite tricarboxylate transporter substrate binding protein n=1 Tax=Microbacterium sp. NPDC078428 TaxID=3364190 RepID=UPI0037C75987
MALIAGVAVAAFALQGCASGGPDGEGDASSYPGGPINYVVPYNPGGSTDPVGREFSRLLAEELGTTAVVENLPGGDETIGLTAVMRSPADGQSMGLSSATGIIVQPLVNESLPFQGPDDYTAVVKMVEAPNAIFVAADSPLQTFDDFVDAATADPGGMSVGTTGRLTNNTFVLVSIEDQLGIDLNIVPFSGGAGEAVLATLSGEVDAVIPTAAGQLGLVESGELRPLVHTGPAEYDEVLPGAVSFTSLELDVPFSSDYVTVAAPGLPEDVQERLVEAAYAVASSEEWAEWCAGVGFLSDPMMGEELDEWIAAVTEASREAIALVEATE